MKQEDTKLSHLKNTIEMHNNASFSRAKLSKEEVLKQKEKIRIEKERKRLEALINKRIEKTDKELERKINKEKKKNKKKFSLFDLFKNNKVSKNKSNVKPQEVKIDKRKEEKIKKQKEKEELLKQKRRKKEEKRKQKEELLKQRKLNKEKKKQEKEQLLKQKEEDKKKTLELEKQKYDEEVLRRQRLKEEKETEKRNLIEQKKLEKQRLKEEKNLLNSNTMPHNLNGIAIENTVEDKKERKKLTREQKLAENAKREEERKERLKQKYEEQARRKREKEEKQIALIKERQEKEKKIRKEKEDSRKERKEKALLIKKAQEESKLKAKKERKTFKEKVNDWYNNLSIVKDAKNRRELQRQTLLIDFEGADAVRSEEKIMYKYVAKNKDTGKVEKGMFAAFSKLDVHSFLLAEGYEVYEISPQAKISNGITLASPKFKSTELDFFLTQLSTFLKSGITLVESVKILSKQSKKSAHTNIYKSIIYELSMGENFSEALAKQGNVFPRLLINMIKTSELTGDLPETLDDMADYYRETEKTRKQMISALTYPIVVLCFAFVILIFIMVSVIPQFVSIYANMETGLPAITITIINLSNFLKSYWMYVVLGVIAFIIMFIVLFKSIKVFRSVVQSLVMNLPIFGKIIIYNEVTMFTKTFASLLNHNVYITDCMEVLSKITNNEVYKMLIFDTITNLAKGEAISNSFKNHWAFPNIAYEMILTGEKTGQLGEMMDKVARYYQEQHKNAVNQIKAFIEPVMIIILAAIVGVVLLSVILPMFDMYQNIGM